MAKHSPEAEMLLVTKTKVFGSIPMLPKDIRDRLSTYVKGFGVSQEAIYLRVFYKVLLMKGIAKPADPKREDSLYWWVHCQKEIEHYCADVKAMSELSFDIRRALTEVGVEYSTDQMETVVRKRLSPDARSLFDELRENCSIFHPFEYDELQKLFQLSTSALDEYVLLRLAEVKKAAIGDELTRHGLNRERRPSEREPGDFESSSKRTKQVRKVVVEECVNQYLTACHSLRTSAPLVVELAESSGLSKGFWSKKLNEPIFIMALKKGVEKKQNLAKTKENVALWIEVSTSLGDLFARVTQRVQRRRKRTHFRERPDAHMDRFPDSAHDGEKEIDDNDSDIPDS